MNDQDLPDDESADELDMLIRMAVRRILNAPDPQAFLAWFADSAPQLAPGMAAQIIGDAVDVRGLFLAMGRLLWNRTPLPDNRYRPRPLPKPERNAPCACGSGRKYKHCCARIESFPDPLEGLSLLKYVLEETPVARFKELPHAHLPLDELDYVAHSWLEEGRAADAVKLLEPLFADLARLDERAEMAFETLADCYDELDRPRQKAQLVEAVCAAPDKRLRSAGLHRRITMVADQGDSPRAWQLFHEAQRFDPDNPFLGALEVTLLQAQGEHERAKERGQFWIARLARDRDHDYGELVARLRELIDNPDELHFEAAARQLPGLAPLRELIEKLPAPQCHYRLEPDEEGAGPLQPNTALARLIKEWRENTQLDRPSLTQLRPGAGGWDDLAPGIVWLAGHPLAWQCFEVLDDLVLGLAEVRREVGTDQLLVLPLLRHAAALLRVVLKANNAEGKTLEWGFHENRPALRLLVNLIHTLLDMKRGDEAVPLMEWAVFELNPNDNHGLREILARSYLERGRAQAALDLCERYPEDMAAMEYDRVLALHALGRLDEAAAALRRASQDSPEVLRMLLAANPRQPKMNPGYVSVGGKDEAWLYRQDYLELWRAGGALEWAASLTAKRARRARP